MFASSEAERWKIPCQICIMNDISSSTRWFACGSFVQRGKWILTVLSVVHYIFTQSPSTVATVIDAEILLGSHRDKRVLTFIWHLSFTVGNFHCTWYMGHEHKLGSRSDLWVSIGAHLDEPVFDHGQLHVAFLRAISFSGIHVQVTPTSNQGRHDEAWTMNNMCLENHCDYCFRGCMWTGVVLGLCVAFVAFLRC